MIDVCRAVRDAALPVQPSIVCFERYPEIIELLRQGKIACTISGDLQEQGRLAMRFLFEYIIYDRTPECSTVYTKTKSSCEMRKFFAAQRTLLVVSAFFVCLFVKVHKNL